MRKLSPRTRTGAHPGGNSGLAVWRHFRWNSVFPVSSECHRKTRRIILAVSFCSVISSWPFQCCSCCTNIMGYDCGTFLEFFLQKTRDSARYCATGNSTDISIQISPLILRAFRQMPPQKLRLLFRAGFSRDKHKSGRKATLKPSCCETKVTQTDSLLHLTARKAPLCVLH